MTIEGQLSVRKWPKLGVFKRNYFFLYNLHISSGEFGVLENSSSEEIE